MIGEHLLTLPLSAADNAVMTGNAPGSDAKARMVQQTAEQVLRELFTDLESDSPPPEILPIVTTGELMAWLKHPDQTLQPHEMPNRNELKDLIYRLGARPLNPEPKDPKQARSVDGKRLYRLVKTWRDKDGRYNLESMSADPPGASAQRARHAAGGSQSSRGRRSLMQDTKRVGYTITEVATMTGRNRTTIHRWLERGVLRAIQVPGGKRLVQAASLERLVSGAVK